MGHPKIVSILLLSSFFLLLISHGFGVEVMETVGHAGYHVSTSLKESGGKSRKMMIEVMDYEDPGPNTNRRAGYPSPPPPPPPSSTLINN